MDLVTGAPLAATDGYASAFQDVPGPVHAEISSSDPIPSEYAIMEGADATATASDAPDALALPMDTSAFAELALPQSDYAQPMRPLQLAGAASMAAAASPLDVPLPLDQPTMNNNLDQQLEAFARLRFSDGSYYMTTYQIILGRNVVLARRDQAKIQKANHLRQRGDDKGADAVLQGRKRKRASHRPHSVVSERGGIVNAPMAAMPVEYQQRRQSVASQSIGSSSHNRADSSQEDVVNQAPQHVLMQAFDEVPAQLEGVVQDNPYDCPIVPIHPQHIIADSAVGGPKAISRQHAKIAFNFETGNFELEVLSRNGLYHEDIFYRKGESIELRHGDTIVIGAVDMTFFLPDVALTEEELARRGSGSRPMSFSFENGKGQLESDDLLSDDSVSENLSVNPRQVYYRLSNEYELDVVDNEDDGVMENDDDEDEDEEEDEEDYPLPTKSRQILKPAVKQKLKLSLKSKAPPPSPPRKETKGGHKRKSVRHHSPEEPSAKRTKTKTKEVRSDIPKDQKEKARVPAKTPAKEPLKYKGTEKSEPSETPKPESPTLSRTEGPEETNEGDQEGIITAEIAKKHGLPESIIGFAMEKRKGPGRPPKDGYMSKRQRAQLVKQGKEIEKARAAGIDVASLPIPMVKPKVARPRKESASNPADGEDDVKESTEKGDGGANSSEKKPAKPSKPPRTPSPELREEDFTEEQLQRPIHNYVVIIYEAISSSSTGQMNLQQIYNYMEKNYPFFKFKVTTSGWQSSVRHNLGQHDAFVKGDKEGKGYFWKINPNVSIEKERRKRQASPPVNHTQRQPYYPPPNGFPQYGQTGTPYYSGMPPQGTTNGLPRPPPGVESVQPRLPPSLARSAVSTATPTAQGAPSHSPYSSPWAAGNATGSSTNQLPSSQYVQSSSQTPAVSTAPAASGQYGVLLPTNAPQTSYGSYTASSHYNGQKAATGTTPHSGASNQPYSPYSASAPTSAVPAAGTVPAAPVSTSTSEEHRPALSRTPHSSGLYPPSTHPDLITQIEAFRGRYLEMTECHNLNRANEEAKVDHAIQAVVNSNLAIPLTMQEQTLADTLRNIETIRPLLTPESGKEVLVKQQNSRDGQVDTKPTEGNETISSAPQTSAATTAATIAASGAASTASNQPSQPLNPTSVMTSSSTSSVDAVTSNVTNQSSATPSSMKPEGTSPHTIAPNMSGSSTSTGTSPVVTTTTATTTSPIRIQNNRPSVEPLTPVPGSPSVVNGASVKRASTETNEHNTPRPSVLEELVKKE